MEKKLPTSRSILHWPTMIAVLIFAFFLGLWSMRYYLLVGIAAAISLQWLAPPYKDIFPHSHYNVSWWYPCILIALLIGIYRGRKKRATSAQ